MRTQQWMYAVLEAGTVVERFGRMTWWQYGPCDRCPEKAPACILVHRIYGASFYETDRACAKCAAYLLDDMTPILHTEVSEVVRLKFLMFPE